MDLDKAQQLLDPIIDRVYLALVEFDTYAQLGIVVVAVFLALMLARGIRAQAPLHRQAGQPAVPAV